MSKTRGLTIAAGAFALAAIVSIVVGSTIVPLADVLAFFSGQPTSAAGVLDARVARTIIAVVAGAALALSGAVLQGVTRNPLADPGLLGINSGAALAVVIGFLLGAGDNQPVLAALSVTGALIAAVTVAVLTRAAGGSPISMVLVGAAVTAGAASLTSALTLTGRGALDLMRFWQVGSVGGRSLSLLVPSLPLLVIGGALTLFCGTTLNTLAVGDDLAAALGTRVRRVQILLTFGAVLLAAGAVAVAGPIGFVGLVVPHVARLLLGFDNRTVIVASVLLGPTLLMVADTVGRLIAMPTEIPVGIVVLIVGAPALIALVLRVVRA